MDSCARSTFSFIFRNRGEMKAMETRIIEDLNRREMRIREDMRTGGARIREDVRELRGGVGELRARVSHIEGRFVSRDTSAPGPGTVPGATPSSGPDFHMPPCHDRASHGAHVTVPCNVSRIRGGSTCCRPPPPEAVIGHAPHRFRSRGRTRRLGPFAVKMQQRSPWERGHLALARGRDTLARRKPPLSARGVFLPAGRVGTGS